MAAPLPSTAELDAYAKPDPELAGIFDHIPRTKLDVDNAEATVWQMRNAWGNLPQFSPIREVHERTAYYETGDGTQLRMLVFTPASSSGPLPVLAWFHGGGSCVGVPEMNTTLCREACMEQQCVVFAPAYRLAPEFKFPIGREDTYDALKHIAANASSLSTSANPKEGFVIGGESAGAVLSSVNALEARDDKLSPPLTGVFIAAGSYFNPDSIPSEYKSHYRSRNDPVCQNAPMLSADAALIFKKCLEPDMQSPFYRASLWPTGFEGLPKTYLQANGMDINRDDSILYDHLLRTQGVETRLDIYPGTPHCFWFLLPESKQGKKWKRDTQSGLRWLFGK